MHIYKAPRCYKVVLHSVKQCRCGLYILVCSIGFLLIWLFLHGLLFAFIFVFQELVRYSKKHILEKNVRDFLMYVLVIATLFGATEMCRG